MPTRKQRRRRKKSFRHEYEYVVIDAEGNEVEIDPDELRPAKATEQEKDKGKERSSKAAPKSGRARAKGAATRGRGREVQPPSWRRVGKRALIFAPLMFVAVTILDDRLTPAQHVFQTLFLLAFFLPFSYVMDTVAYRMFLRRTGQTPARREKA